MDKQAQKVVNAAVSTLILMATAGAVLTLRDTERSYPGLSPAARHLQQGLDHLTVDVNRPFDYSGAVEHFGLVSGDAASTAREREIADFLTGWCALVEPVTHFGEARRLLTEYVEAYPDSHLITEAYFLLGLTELYNPFDAGAPMRAVVWLKRVVEHAPDSALAAYASVALAGVYRSAVKDAAEAARWYGTAFEKTSHTHLLDERLGFRYIEGRLLEGLGQRDAAARCYEQILQLGESQTSLWVDRCLDRLSKLGVAVEKDYFPGIVAAPEPMSDYQFETKAPVELTVSFYVLEKLGMGKAVQEIAERYEARTPQVKIRLVDLPFDMYYQWAQSRLLGKDVPDIMQMDPWTSFKYGANEGKLLDLSPYLASVNPYTGKVWSGMYYPQFILSTRDPVYLKNWVISWAAEATAFFYNKDAFRAAGVVARDASGEALRDAQGKLVVAEPATWGELMEAFRKLRAIGVYGEVQDSFPIPMSLFWEFPYVRLQIYDDLIPRLDRDIPDDYPDPFEMARSLLDGTLDLRAPDVAEFWRLFYEKNEYCVPGTASLLMRDARNLFVQGRAATLFCVSTDLPTVKQMCDFEVGVFSFPLLKESPYYDGEYSTQFDISGFEFCLPKVNKNETSLAAAVDFLMYFTSPEAQQILCRESVCVSPIKGIPVPEEVKPFTTHMNKRGTYTVYFDPYAIAVLRAPYWQDARDKLVDHWNQLRTKIPNYAYYRTIIGGSEEDYARWREEALERFLESIQEYFTFANRQVISEYPEDIKRQLARTQHLWIQHFREVYCPSPFTEGDRDESVEKLANNWRNVFDNLSTIDRCERLLDPAERAGRYAPSRYTSGTRMAVTKLVKIALMVGACVVLLILLWNGTLARLARDFGYIRALLPTLLLLGVFIYVPALSAIYHAFFRWNGSDISEFVGLDNFRTMLTDEILQRAAVVMAAFLVVNVLKLVPTILASVLLFHLVSRRWQYAFRVVFVLPMAVPGIVTLLIWKYFYRMDGGLLNWLLLKLNVIQAPVDWLGTEQTVVPAIMFIGFPWINTIGVLILLAGLQSISRSMFEAASVDGCGVWRRFWSIELPLMMGVIKLNVVLTTIGTVQDFWLPLVLTNGGPNNASMLPGLWMFRNAFDYGRMGYAAALGLVMFLVILMFTYFNMRFIATTEE